MVLTGKNVSRKKTYPSATLSTTNPPLTGLVLNPLFRGERPATNRLSRGTAYRRVKIEVQESVVLTLLQFSVSLCIREEHRGRTSFILFMSVH
jgi:hypothetical protein